MKITQVLLILFLPITIIFSNLLFLTNNNNFYQTIYEKENIYQNFQSKVQVDNATKELIGYFRGQNNLEGNYYSVQAITHLEDVKRLIKFTVAIDVMSILLSLGLMIVLIIKNKAYLISKSLIIGSIVTFLIVMLVLIAFITNFDSGFVVFHKIFFRNDLWLFAPDDNLIKLFPESFFQEFTKNLITNVLITLALLLSINYFLFKKKDDSKSN